MTPQIELSGVAVVAVGSFNPPIFHPSWFQRNELLAENEAEHAMQEIVLTPELTAFTADWASLQVTTRQSIFATVEEARELQLRDLVRGTFEFLPETPIDAVGINSDAHFKVESQEKWHELGDRFCPKDFWRPVFEGGPWKGRNGDEDVVGMRTLTVEVVWDDEGGYVRLEVAPSERLQPNGVYIGINAHLQLRVGEERSSGKQLAQAVLDRWDEVRDLERDLQGKVLDAAE